jgi:hypothetical protein
MNEEGQCSECSTMKEEDETVVTSMDDLGEGDDEEIVTSLDQLGESKKATLRLSESELVSLISRMVSESVPGLEFTKKAQKTSGDDSKSHMSDVKEKLKDISTFDGNDNPEFPNQINKGEKVAQRTTDEENETIEDNRGGGMEDLQYDYEPSERFKVRCNGYYRYKIQKSIANEIKYFGVDTQYDNVCVKKITYKQIV